MELLLDAGFVAFLKNYPELHTHIYPEMTDADVDLVIGELQRAYQSSPPVPQIKALAQGLHSDGLSLRSISQRLAKEGFKGPTGKLYGAESIKWILKPGFGDTPPIEPTK